MTKLKDISLFFISDCCNGGAKPLSKRPPAIDPIKYFQKRFNTLPEHNESLHAATITIGNVYYGKMSSEQQYKHFVKAIKNCYPYNGETKYVFYFEFQKNGQLHAHGAIYNGYQSRFADHFNKFGLRNCHDLSYQQIKKSDYFSYIIKEKEKMKKYKPIHNIKRSDIR